MNETTDWASALAISGGRSRARITLASRSASAVLWNSVRFSMVVAAMSGLILWQPDLGTALMLVLIAVAMVFAAGVSPLVGQPTSKWHVPQVPEGASRYVTPGAPDLSAILVRMKSRRPSTQMPPLGTVLHDREAIALVTAWIDSLR